MKVSAIIAEYNPFHDGHKYHIEKTREKTGSTHIIAVMSGNFTQRGDTAILPKHARAKAAICGGVDLVIELPSAFALSSAQQFATGAISLINSLGCIDFLSFGSESGNLSPIEEAASAVCYAQTTDEFFSALRRGKTYPAALSSAVEAYYTSDVVDTLNTPNNTLAVEYLKALSDIGSTIKPFTVKRVGVSHDEMGDNQSGFKSASQLREECLSGKLDIDAVTDFSDINRLETAILAKLRTLSPKEIKKAPNVNGGLENRIFKASRVARTLDELYALSKTKRYTMARIRRAIICCFLGITCGDVKLLPQYVRILGMNDKGKEILSKAKECGCTLPIDTSLKSLMEKSDKARRQALLEDRCTNIYALSFERNKVCGGEFTQKAII